MPARLSALWSAVLRWGEARAFDEQTVLLLFAILVGSTAALGTVAFYQAMDVAYHLFFRWLGQDVPLLPRLVYRPLATAVAFAGAEALWRRVGRGSDGMTVPDVQLAVVRHGGHLPLGPAAGRTLASVITIGGGGSAGSEGPVAVLGAALASKLSRGFRFAASQTRVLVAAGTAAGISAAFNAPLAGAFFALEEVLGTFRGDHFAPVVVASVTAAIISRGVFGNHPAFALPERYGYDGALEVLWAFPLVGMACGLATVLFVAVHFRLADRVAGWRRQSRWSGALPWLSGAAVGAAVTLSDGLLVGVGHLAIPLQQFAAMSTGAVLLLALGKVVITSVTLQGGGSGGVFTPSLFVGAALGSAVALLLRLVLPSFTSAPEAYALVGMGAMVAATTGAPITAALLVFEITGDYAIVPPLMVCVALSQLVARRFTPDTLYSGWLRRRGERLEHGRDRAALEGLRVRDVYAADAPVLGEGASVRDALDCFEHAAPSLVPIVDAERRLVGVVTAAEVSALARAPRAVDALLVMGDIAVPCEAVDATASLAVATARMGLRGLGALPVAEPVSGRIIGVVDRGHVLRAYERAVRGGT
jgi:CIC family chloride channel protein